MNFLGVGAGEALLVFVIALIVIGPHRFPEAMRQAGRWYRMARAYSNEVMKDVRAAVDDIEREIETETEDLRSVRELTDLSGELRKTQEAAAEAEKDTRAALQSGAAAATDVAPSTTSPRPIRPSQRTSTSPSATGAGAAEPADEEPATFDPFKQRKSTRNTPRTRTPSKPKAADEDATTANGASEAATDAVPEREG